MAITVVASAGFASGANATYTLTLTNNGPQSAAGPITVTDTLPAGLTLFGGQHVTDHAVLLAGATISLLPLAAAFLLAQKYFVAGIATTGLK